MLFSIALLFSFVSYAQKKVSEELFSGATKIIVRNDQTGAENYKLAAKVLFDQDYAIDKSDKEFFQLYTESVPVYGEGVSRALTIYVVSKDNQITIIGKTKKKAGLQLVNTNPDTDKFEILPYKNSKLLKEIFNKLEAYAKALNGKLITYSE